MADARKLFEELQQVLETNIKELEELRALKSRLNDIVAQNSCAIIKLNVGGTLFTTSAKTLAEVPGSLLAGIVGQAVAVPTQPDGSIFIDRNPRLFPYILDYYRKKGAVNLGGLSSADVSDLIDEASYFNLTDFVSTLSGKSEAPMTEANRCSTAAATTAAPKTNISDITMVPPPPADIVAAAAAATATSSLTSPPAVAQTTAVPVTSRTVKNFAVPPASQSKPIAILQHTQVGLMDSGSPLPPPPSEVLESSSASSSPSPSPSPSPAITATHAKGAAPPSLVRPHNKLQNSIYPDNYQQQAPSAPYRTLTSDTGFYAPKAPEPLFPPTTTDMAAATTATAPPPPPSAPPQQQQQMQAPPPAIEADIYPSAPPPQFIPPPTHTSSVYGYKQQANCQPPPPPPPYYGGSQGTSMPPPPQYNPPQDASMYGLNQLPPPPAYQPQGVRPKQQFSQQQQQQQQLPPPPAYGSRGPVGPSAGMVGARRMQAQEQKPIWKCDINPLVTIQANTVLKTPKGISAIVYSPLKTFSRGNHTFTVEIDYSDGKASIGLITKKAFDRFKARFNAMNPVQQTREMEMYRFIGNDEEEWGIQEGAFFYNSGSRYDTNQPVWRKGSRITYNIRIDSDIGMVDFARGDNHWTQTIARSETVVFIVLAAPGVSYSITG